MIATTPADAGTLTVEASRELRTMDRRRLLGSNVAGWYFKKSYDDPQIRGWIRELGPILLRLPGGSWGDGTFWNGNGVRKGDDVDYTKLNRTPYSKWSAPWGTWNIDYTGYAPGFLVDVKPNEKPVMLSTKWHGHVDVKTMHDFVRELGNEPFVIVNGGTGSPRDAAEWVRWANQTMGYHVRYWEVGNELGGSWEAGNFLPDGSRLNGEIYARRYEEFARAMKAVDPTIKVGTMDWLEDVLKQCGDLVDFFSIHAYPAGIGNGPGSMPDDVLFSKLDEARRTLVEAKATIRKIRPDLESRIELDFSEWNIMGWPDIRGALWHAGWVGEMFRHGADFATEWDLFTLVAHAEPLSARRNLYWPFWLWSRAMGDTLVATDLQGAKRAGVYATRSNGGLSVMVINQSADHPLELDVNIRGFEPGKTGREVRFTPREFFWLDREPGKPDWQKNPSGIWNTGPTVRSFNTGKRFNASVPPSSIIVYVIPDAGREPDLPETPKPDVRTPNLALWIPPDLYAGDDVEVWAYARNGDEDAPFPGTLQPGRITITGPARADRKTVDLSQAAGRFTIKGSRPGSATIEVRSGKAKAIQAVSFKPSVPKPRIFWEFEEPAKPGYVRSHWTWALDPGIRPNQQVAAIALAGETPDNDRMRELLVISEFPKEDVLDRGNIRGVLFDIRLSSDFQATDPEAFVEVVMQSTMNWWMKLGRVRLSDIPRGDWKSETLLTGDPGLVKAMPKAFNVLFTISSKAPVRGSIYLDRVGLMVR